MVLQDRWSLKTGFTVFVWQNMAVSVFMEMSHVTQSCCVSVVRETGTVMNLDYWKVQHFSKGHLELAVGESVKYGVDG